MSNMLYGDIICTSSMSEQCGWEKKLVQYCLDNDFGIRYINAFHQANSEQVFRFQLADTFIQSNCEDLLAPMIYSEDGEPQTVSFCRDLEKLYGFVQEIFSLADVEKVILRFTPVEVDEEEYDVCVTVLPKMKQVIFQKFLGEQEFPVLKVIIYRG